MRVRTVPTGDGSGNRMGSSASGINMSLTQRRAQRYYSLDAARVLRAGDEGHGVAWSDLGSDLE